MARRQTRTTTPTTVDRVAELLDALNTIEGCSCWVGNMIWKVLESYMILMMRSVIYLRVCQMKYMTTLMSIVAEVVWVPTLQS